MEEEDRQFIFTEEGSDDLIELRNLITKEYCLN